MDVSSWMAFAGIMITAIINFSILAFYMGKVSSKLQHLERQMLDTKSELKEAREIRIKHVEQMALTSARLESICGKVDRMLQHVEKTIEGNKAA